MSDMLFPDFVINISLHSGKAHLLPERAYNLFIVNGVGSSLGIIKFPFI